MVIIFWYYFDVYLLHFKNDIRNFKYIHDISANYSNSFDLIILRNLNWFIIIFIFTCQTFLLYSLINQILIYQFTQVSVVTVITLYYPLLWNKWEESYYIEKNWEKSHITLEKFKWQRAILFCQKSQIRLASHRLPTPGLDYDILFPSADFGIRITYHPDNFPPQ